MEQLKARKKSIKDINFEVKYNFSGLTSEELLLLSKSFLSLAELSINEGYSKIVSSNLFALGNLFLKAGTEIKKVQ